MKGLFFDADGTLWYVGDEESDGHRHPPTELVVDPHLTFLLNRLGDMDIPFWIVSYNDEGVVERAVTYLGLSGRIPPSCISGGWTPKAERIREIMKIFNLDRGLFVGDRRGDYMAGVEAGVKAFIIKRKFNKSQLVEGCTINSLLEILPILENL